VRVVDEVRRFVKAHLRGDGPGVAAVSGGADSVALLRALLETGRTVTVTHLNHQLRGAESDADEAFVRELAAALGVGFRSTRIDVLAIGGNLEATARRVRYEWLSEVAAEVGAGWVATGHTADDQAETVLHRLLRGTGLQGLRGIAASKLLDEPPGLSRRCSTLPSTAGTSPTARRVVRPLLTVTRAEVLDYLAALNQPYRTDATNADPRFTRIRIRAELLPLLRTFNPDVVDALNRLARQADEAHEVVTGLARDLLARAELPRAADSVILDIGTLRSAPRLVVRTALRLVWEREGWPMGEMDFDHWERAVEVARRDARGCNFPGGVFAHNRGVVVRLGRQS
jgi:tRNA(Ile)-lysidine synthase